MTGDQIDAGRIVISAGAVYAFVVAFVGAVATLAWQVATYKGKIEARIDGLAMAIADQTKAIATDVQHRIDLLSAKIGAEVDRAHDVFSSNVATLGENVSRQERRIDVIDERVRGLDERMRDIERDSRRVS